jgi:hypothetical protein
MVLWPGGRKRISARCGHFTPRLLPCPAARRSSADSMRRLIRDGPEPAWRMGLRLFKRMVYGPGAFTREDTDKERGPLGTEGSGS